MDTIYLWRKPEIIQATIQLYKRNIPYDIIVKILSFVKTQFEETKNFKICSSCKEWIHIDCETFYHLCL